MKPKKLIAKREASHPHYWIVKDDSGKQIDRDKYSNDLKERYAAPEYDLTFDIRV